MKIFLTLMIAISALYSIIVIHLFYSISQVIVSVDNDLKTFLAESDMLQIEALFMGPFDEFMAVRYCLFNYGNMLKAGTMSQQKYDFLKIFPRSRLSSGYDDLKTNFNKQLKNPRLHQFFQDKFIDIRLMLSGANDLYWYRNISFRASLNILLNYQYTYKLAYQFNRTVTGTAFLVYQYANYFTFIENF